MVTQHKKRFISLLATTPTPTQAYFTTRIARFGTSSLAPIITRCKSTRSMRMVQLALELLFLVRPPSLPLPFPHDPGCRYANTKTKKKREEPTKHPVFSRQTVSTFSSSPARPGGARIPTRSSGRLPSTGRGKAGAILRRKRRRHMGRRTPSNSPLKVLRRPHTYTWATLGIPRAARGRSMFGCP